ncbi:hypothetical protein D039_5097B, partial [Vibrio parahaemolyticus EKP-028]
ASELTVTVYHCYVTHLSHAA